MPKYTFVTDVECQENLIGVVTGVRRARKTVEILSETEVQNIVDAAISQINNDTQRLLNILDQFKPKPPHGTKSEFEKAVREVRNNALAAAKDAAAAREEVNRFVETARETFRDVIEELLVPHYRRLAELSGIEPLQPKISLEEAEGSTANAKPRKTTKSKKEKESTSAKAKPQRQSRTKAGNGTGTTKPKTKSQSAKPARTRMAKKQ